jgi:hypothetical protein
MYIAIPAIAAVTGTAMNFDILHNESIDTFMTYSKGQ